eukprot:5221641-Pyramimonas_sp.AAC.1
MPALPRVSVDPIRLASRSCNSRSAVSVDGFHMRRFRLLCNESLEALSYIFGIIEMMSTLPIQIRLVMLAMLPKPMGGLRPIGIF